MLQNPIQKDNDTINQRISPFVAGIVAGAASITALALSDKDIRKKVSKRATEMRMSMQKWSSTKYKQNTKGTNDNLIEETAETLIVEDDTKN